MEGNNLDEILSFDFLATVKTLLGITDGKEDGLLNILINNTRQEILNYCNLRNLPSELNYTLCFMAVDIYRDSKNKTETGNIAGNVSSVSEDGRTVAFFSGAELKTSVHDKVSKTEELKRYRKMYRV